MFLYGLTAWAVVLFGSLLADALVWGGRHWAIILAILAMPTFGWVNWAFIRYCTDIPRDLTRDRATEALDARLTNLQRWWRRRLVFSRRRLRRLFRMSISAR